MKIILIPFLLMFSLIAHSQDDETYDVINYDKAAKPVKGMKFLYGRFGEIEKASCFQSIPDSGRFKVFLQFVISKEGKLADDSIRILRTPFELKPECIAQIRNALDVEWTIPKQMGKTVRQRFVMPLIFREDE